MGLLKKVVGSVQSAVKKVTGVLGDSVKAGTNSITNNILAGKQVFGESSFKNEGIYKASSNLQLVKSTVEKKVVTDVLNKPTVKQDTPKSPTNVLPGPPQKKPEGLVKAAVVSSNVIESTQQPPMGIIQNLIQSPVVGTIAGNLLSGAIQQFTPQRQPTPVQQATLQPPPPPVSENYYANIKPDLDAVQKALFGKSTPTSPPPPPKKEPWSITMILTVVGIGLSIIGIVIFIFTRKRR